MREPRPLPVAPLRRHGERVGVRGRNRHSSSNDCDSIALECGRLDEMVPQVPK